MPESEARYRFVGADGRVLSGMPPADALSLGEGAFETVLVLSGRPAMARRHLLRLERSCAELGICRTEEARAIFAAGLDFAASEPELRARLRTAVLGEEGGRAVGIITVRAASEPPQSISLAVSDSLRSTTDHMATHKTTSYFGNVTARRRAQAAGSDDALIVDTERNVAETSSANIFAVLHGVLATPAEGCILRGTVRDWVIEGSGKSWPRVEERRIALTELLSAEAAFVTNAVIGIVPVSRVGERMLPPASGFEWFRLLQDAFRAAVSAE